MGFILEIKEIKSTTVQQYTGTKVSVLKSKKCMKFKEILSECNIK